MPICRRCLFLDDAESAALECPRNWLGLRWQAGLWPSGTRWSVDEGVVRAGWEREQALLGFAPDTPDDEFSVGGLAGLATPPTVRICLLPGDLYTVAIPPQEPATVIPQLITLPCGWQLPHHGTVRGTSRGYVAVSQSGEKGPWRSFVAVAWHGGVDFFLGDQGGREWDAPPGSRRRLFYLQKVIGWAWAAFDLQREMVERFTVGGPFRAIVAVAHTSGASLATFGAGGQSRGARASGTSRPQSTSTRCSDRTSPNGQMQGA